MPTGLQIQKPAIHSTPHGRGSAPPSARTSLVTMGSAGDGALLPAPSYGAPPPARAPLGAPHSAADRRRDKAVWPPEGSMVAQGLQYATMHPRTLTDLCRWSTPSPRAWITSFTQTQAYVHVCTCRRDLILIQVHSFSGRMAGIFC